MEWARPTPAVGCVALARRKRPRETLVLATFPSNDAPSAEYPHCSHPWAERHPVVIPRDGERNRAWPLAQATHLVCHVSQTGTRGRGVERLTSIHRRTLPRREPRRRPSRSAAGSFPRAVTPSHRLSPLHPAARTAPCALPQAHTLAQAPAPRRALQRRAPHFFEQTRR